MKRILLQYFFIIIFTICFLFFLEKHIGIGGGYYFVFLTIACINFLSIVIHSFLFFFVYPIIRHFCQKIREIYVLILLEFLFLFIYSIVVWDLFTDICRFLLIFTILFSQMLAFLFYKSK